MKILNVGMLKVKFESALENFEFIRSLLELAVLLKLGKRYTVVKSVAKKLTITQYYVMRKNKKDQSASTRAAGGRTPGHFVSPIINIYSPSLMNAPD